MDLLNPIALKQFIDEQIEQIKAPLPFLPQFRNYHFLDAHINKILSRIQTHVNNYCDKAFREAFTEMLVQTICDQKREEYEQLVKAYTESKLLVDYVVEPTTTVPTGLTPQQKLAKMQKLIEDLPESTSMTGSARSQVYGQARAELIDSFNQMRAKRAQLERLRGLHQQLRGISAVVKPKTTSGTNNEALDSDEEVERATTVGNYADPQPEITQFIKLVETKVPQKPTT